MSESVVDISRILLVEDDTSYALLVREMLKRKGLFASQVTHVVSLAKAVETLKKESFDLILLDLTLPDSSGIDTLRNVIPLAASSPIVVITAMDDDEFAMQAMEEGAQDYLVKGEIDLKTIVRTVSYAMERKKAGDALSETQKKYSSLFNLANDVILIIDPESEKILDANITATEQFGYNRNELLTFTLSNLRHPESKLDTGSFLKRIAGGESVVAEGGYRKKDGSLLPVEVSARLVSYDQKKVALAYLRDITDRKLAEKELKQSVKSLRDITSTIGEGVCVVDHKMKVTFVNPEASRLLGWTADELIGKNAHAKFHYVNPDGTPHKLEECIVQKSIRVGRDFHLGEEIFVSKTGKFLPVSLTCTCIKADNEVTGAVLAFHDISDRIKTNKDLKLAASFFNHAVEGIMITGPDTVIESVNKAFTDITGYKTEDVIGQKPGILRSDRHNKIFYEKMWEVLSKDGMWRGEIWNRRKDGEAYLQSMTISAIKEPSGEVTHYTAIFYDITELKRSEEEIRYRANHDALTGLPNRSLFKDRLKDAVARSKRENRKLAVLFIDLDNFKIVNESLGHTTGDMFLQGVAIRLVSQLREGDTVSRYSGDEFTVLLDNLHEDEDAARAGQKIIQALSEAYLHKGQEIVVTGSVGASLYPTDGADPDSLIKNAEMAMHHSKERSKSGCQLFNESMNMKVVERLNLESMLRKAVEAEEFVVFYQPKVNMTTGRVCGMEALVRWPRPDGEIISPFRFIPLAEETGLIIPIGEQVLRAACASIKQWRDNGYPELTVSVNLAASQLDLPDLTGIVSASLAKCGLGPEGLCLEVTETAMMKNMETTISNINKLKELGIKISMDDFGSGYSSMSHLKKFPIDELKIDQAFVRTIPHEKDDSAIAVAIVSMAKALRLHTVVEGVETMEQLKFFRDLECDELQGYLFSRPVPGAEIPALLNKTLDDIKL